MPAKKISISLMESQENVELRAGDGDGRRSDTLGTSGVIDRDLTRYYEALRRSRAKLRKIFQPNEIAAIMDNLNGVWLTHNPEIGIAGIPLNLIDGIELNGLDAKWKFHAGEFMQKIQGNNGNIPALSFLDLCAIADCAERFWQSVSAGEELRPEDAFNEDS